MIYTILCDGINIYDASADMGIISPQLDLELNNSGSLTFTMLPNHHYYNDVKELVSDIEVYKEGVEKPIFFGRVIDTTIDFFNRKKVVCEGALGFFNDTVQLPRVFEKVDPEEEGGEPLNDEIYISDFLEYLITEHNKFVTLPTRQFKMGTFSMTDKKVYRELNYDKTIDCIKTMCIDAEGGYISIRKEEDGNYVDWAPNLPGVSTQPIQYALNLTDLTQDFKGSTLVTCIIPIGKDDLTLQTPDADGDGQPDQDVNERNPGQIYVDSDAVETYGRIVEKVDFSDVETKERLYEKAVKWLEDNQFDTLSISVSSADLSYFNPEYTTFALGDNVHVVSDPHLIDKDFPIVKISYHLDSPTQQITIGTVPRESLTEIYASGGGGGKNSASKSDAKRIAKKAAETAVGNIDYVEEIANHLDLIVDETDETIHALYGDNPENSESLLLDSTGNDIVDALDDIADRVLHIADYTDPDPEPEPEEEPEEPGE